MSGEQRRPPRPIDAVSSRMQPLSLEGLNESVGSLVLAQQSTTLAVQDLAKDMTTFKTTLVEEIGKLAVRVQKVEADANWKRWAITAAKTLWPAAVGYVAAKYPELARHLPSDPTPFLQ